MGDSACSTRYTSAQKSLIIIGSLEDEARLAIPRSQHVHAEQVLVSWRSVDRNTTGDTRSR